MNRKRPAACGVFDAGAPVTLAGYLEMEDE